LCLRGLLEGFFATPQRLGRRHVRQSVLADRSEECFERVDVDVQLRVGLRAAKTSPTPRRRTPAYIQDIANWGGLRLIPAVRYDRYQLKPMPDTLFANSTAGSQITVSPISATAVSPSSV
jgi:hypothetical protein